MLRKSLLSLLLAVLLLAGFIYGIVQLLSLRYAAGDIYPPYSSLRSDPLGVQGIYDAMADLPGFSVRRNFKPLPRLAAPHPITLFYAGVPHHSFWSTQELAAFDTLVVGGSRAVFTFFPIERAQSEREDERAQESAHARKLEKGAAAKKSTPERKASSPSPAKAEKKLPTSPEPKAEPAAKKDEPAKEQPAQKRTPKPKSKGTQKGDEPADNDEDVDRSLVAFSEVGKRWGFQFAYLPEHKGAAEKRLAKVEPSAGALEGQLAWHGALCFRELKPLWKVLYRCESQPVVIERPYGSGSIVLAAESFFVSNEALRADRHPQLLAHLFSGPPDIVFDEEHQGIREEPGIASLVRKYRLHGVMAGLLLMALLFVWQNAVRFVPPYPAADFETGVVRGREAEQGLVNLLRRSVPARELLATCASEWRKAFGQQARLEAKFTAALAVEEALPSKDRDPVRAYRQISQALKPSR